MAEIEKIKRPLILKLIIIFYFLSSLLILGVAMISFFKSDLLLEVPKVSAIDPSSYPEVFIVFGYLMLILSIICFISAIGLIRIKNWARILVIVLCLINIIGGIFSITEGSYISIINLLVNLLIGSYLLFNSKIKLIFRNKNKIHLKKDKNSEKEEKHKDDKEDLKKIIDNIKDKKK